MAPPAIYVVEVMLYCASGKQLKPIPCPAGEKGEMLVVPVLLSLIARFSVIRMPLPSDLRPADARTGIILSFISQFILICYFAFMYTQNLIHSLSGIFKSITEIKRRFPDGLPNLDPILDMKIKSKDFEKAVHKVEVLEQLLFTHILSKADDLAGLMQLCALKVLGGEYVFTFKYFKINMHKHIHHARIRFMTLLYLTNCTH